MGKYQQFLELPNEDTFIWRYMSFEKFLYILQEKKLYFCRLDFLTDKYEGTLPTSNEREFYNSLLNVPLVTEAQARKISDTDKRIILKHREFSLINCWSIDNQESLILWKLYAINGFGISIKSTVGNLQRSFYNNKEIHIGKVKYDYKAKDIGKSKICFLKKEHYSFEKELRVAILDQYTHSPDKKQYEWCPKYSRGVSIEIDVDMLIKEIYLSPFAPNWFYEFLRNIIKNYLGENSASLIKNSFFK